MKRYELHSHTFVSGPRANGMFIREKQCTTSTFWHSHEGGDEPHQHADTGPACYAIDKDEWARATGLRGGGRKSFTTEPTGEQFPIVALEEWQRRFAVKVVGPPAADGSTGPGFAPAARMILGFGMDAEIDYGDGGPVTLIKGRRSTPVRSAS